MREDGQGSGNSKGVIRQVIQINKLLRIVLSIFLGTLLITVLFMLIFYLSSNHQGNDTQTPTSTPTLTPTPTPTPQPDLSGQIVEIENYGSGLGLSKDVILILHPAYSQGKASQEYINNVKEVMLQLSKIPAKYESFTKFRESAAQTVMEDRTITLNDKKTVVEYGNLINTNISEMKELKKEDFTLEDGKQTDLEKKYLANPNDSKLDEDLRNYYLEEIEKIYPELSKELKELPELSTSKVDKQSLEALEDIYGLLLTAKPYKNYNDRFKSNIPKENETWEAFELMLKGGTPDQKNFEYDVEDYNVQLELLLKVAEKREFKKNDTLAQSIALTHGFWYIIGSNKVKEAIYKDISDLLDFFRETNMIQLERGYHPLEELSLINKIVLSWRGDQTSPGYDKATLGKYHDPIWYHLNTKMEYLDYKWATIDIPTLRDARKLMDQKGWINKNINASVEHLENEFNLDQSNWDFAFENPQKITFRGETFLNANFNNSDIEFEYYIQNTKGIGACAEQVGLLNVFLKSWGIPSIEYIGYQFNEKGKSMWGDAIILYLDYLGEKYKLTKNSRIEIHIEKQANTFLLVSPLTNFLDLKKHLSMGEENFPSYIIQLPYIEARTVGGLLLNGISSSMIKQLFLYP